MYAHFDIQIFSQILQFVNDLTFNVDIYMVLSQSVEHFCFDLSRAVNFMSNFNPI